MEEIRCSVCGTVVNPGDTFCQNCGSPVNAAPSAQPEAASVQPDTTVLSGNPFSGSNPEPQTTNPGMNTGYQSANAGVNSAYQQTPSGMDTNAQGTYGTYNTTYNVNNYTQTAPEKQSKALGIVGLILGILGILTFCCYGGLLFGLIGLILSIVYLTKKGSKGLGISGVIVSAIGLIASIIWLIIAVGTGKSFADWYNQDLDDITSGYSTGDTTGSGTGISTSNVSGTDQILVNGSDLYTLPASLSSLGLSVSDSYSEEVEDIQTNGLYAGDYKFVVLDSDNGYSFWGFVENTGSDTVYSLEDCQVTGINVDNYSSFCTAWSAEVYGGVTLDMSRFTVESLIGYPDTTDDDGFEVYLSDSENEVLRLEYDDYDYVIAIDLTTYN